MAADQLDPFKLRLALDGDERAWTAIVNEFSTTIWHWARSAGLSRDDAEDVAQIVWYRLKDRGHTIRDPARLAGWLARTTANEARVARNRARRELGIDPVTNGANLLVDARSRPDDLALVGETRQQIAEAYAQLNDTCREILPLCWSGLTVAEIAESLGRAPGYVGPTRMRCLQKLRELAAIDA